MDFKALHEQDRPLLLGNVWDVPSALAAGQQHYQALGTSSAALARALGYQDGGKLPFAELEYMVSRIASATTLPLSVDLEHGYSDAPEEVAAHCIALHRLGVVGINIEDSRVGLKRELLPAEEFAHKLSYLKEKLRQEQIAMFINVRTDPFLLEMPRALEETLHRAGRYKDAGADGLFAPGLVDEVAIKTLVSTTALPINVMAMPGLPKFDTLATLGVKRISMGNFLFEAARSQMEDLFQAVSVQQSFDPLFVCP